MAGVADQAAVKEYISKYQLEDELSAAGNMAIKANSDNPFKLISDYLKTLADPEDSEADDDDDDMMEEEGEASMPATKPRGRRAQVMAVKVDIPADFKPPVYPKSPEVEAWLSEVMDENKLMKMLSPSDRKQLMLALKEVTFSVGDKIIKQGDAGDNLRSRPGRVRHPRRRQGIRDEGQEGRRLWRARAAAQRAARGDSHRRGACDGVGARHPVLQEHPDGEGEQRRRLADEDARRHRPAQGPVQGGQADGVHLDEGKGLQVGSYDHLRGRRGQHLLHNSGW